MSPAHQPAEHPHQFLQRQCRRLAGHVRPHGEARRSLGGRMNRETALESLRLRFTSGNSVPVDRATISRAEYEALLAALSSPVADGGDMAEALRWIARHGCENYIKPWECRKDPARSRAAQYAADGWCDACVAMDALAAAPTAPV